MNNLYIELIITFVILVIFSAYRRVISGKKNGAFYAKGNRNIKDKKIKSWINNLHRLETPAWYAQFIPVFFVTLNFLRIYIFSLELEFHYDILNLIEQFTLTLIATMSISGLGYKNYQKYINIGAGVVDDDPIKTELIFKYPTLVKGKIVYKEYFFYYNKFWEKWGDNTITLMSFISLVLSFIYVIFFI